MFPWPRIVLLGKVTFPLVVPAVPCTTVNFVSVGTLATTKDPSVAPPLVKSKYTMCPTKKP